MGSQWLHDVLMYLVSSECLLHAFCFHSFSLGRRALYLSHDTTIPHKKGLDLQSGQSKPRIKAKIKTLSISHNIFLQKKDEKMKKSLTVTYDVHYF